MNIRELKDNKELYVMQKKSAMKMADAILCPIAEGSNFATKSEQSESDTLQAKLVINTTGILDSHRDVHIHGLWNKTLKESRKVRLIQEHAMKFDHVISDNVKAYTKTVAWSKLGYNYEGSTQALMFDAEINPTRNPFMYKQYLNGYVDNHSVGMQYVTLFLCINSEDKYYREEKENWDKYVQYVANKEELGEYFWAVTEAKLIEGSAVLYGSNYATPVYSIKSPEPAESTQDAAEKITAEDVRQLLKNHLNLQK
jgi:hypothetical protein